MATNETQERGQATDGVTAQAQELAAQAKEQAQEKVEEVKGHASDRLHEQLDRQSTNLAERIVPFPEALRKAAEYLDSQDSGPAAKLAGQAADRAEEFASYLEEASSDRILGDVEAFARRRAWVVGGIATAAGFVASRFLMASSERRYESRSQHAPQPRLGSSAPADETSGFPAPHFESSVGGR